MSLPAASRSWFFFITTTTYWWLSSRGPFHWHKHDDTDDFFLVLKGTLDIELRDRTVTLKPGEVFVVPTSVEHRPVAREEVHILLIEPTGTANTGDKATAAPRILA
jgi:mannose-6-phosphate isomerase-like protein (cupin superfamily)